MGQGEGNAAIHKGVVAEYQLVEIWEVSQDSAYLIGESLTPAQGILHGSGLVI